MKLTERGKWIVAAIAIFMAFDAIRFHLSVTNGRDGMAPFVPIPMARYGTTYKGN